MAFEHKTGGIDLQEIVGLNRFLGLWKLLEGFRSIYVLAALSLGVSAVLRTGTYFLIRYFVDDALVDENRASLLPMIAIGFIGIALLQGTFTFISGRLAAKTSESVVLRLRNYLYDHIQRLSFSYHDETPTGDLIQRTTSDVDAIRRFYADQAIGMGRIFLLFLVNLTALLFLSWKLALFSVIVVPFVVLLSLFFFRRISDAYEEYHKQDAIASTTLQENLT